MIELKHLEKKYEGLSPLKDVNVIINDGDVISIIGPSGTGKSTLLRCINLLEKPTAGQIIFDGVDITAPGYDITKARRRIGMVFQSFNLFGHLTVIENIMMPQMNILKKNRQEAYDTGVRLLDRVGLGGRELQYPNQLSGGQQQRVAIARALAMDPDVLLLDEPTSALDPTMVGEVQAVIRDLANSGKTMLIVTHEMNFAKAIANRVFFVDEGGIYEDGTPEQIFDAPQKENTRIFIRKIKVFEAVIDSKNFDFISFGTELDRYLFNNDVLPGDKYRIRLAIEEMVQQILLPKLDDPFIRIKTEYSLKDEACQITITYKGKAFDVNDTDNKLSLNMIKNTVKDLQYTYKEGEDEPNSVELWISNKDKQ